MQRWRVFKFGGSSVADAACMERVAAIVEGEPAGPLAVVLSASRGVTDALLDLVARPSGRRTPTRHWPRCASATPTWPRRCARPAESPAYTAVLDADCRDIAALLQAVRLTRSASPARRATWSSASASSGRRGSSRACSRPAPARRAGAVDRRARHRGGGVGPPRSGVRWAVVAREGRRAPWRRRRRRHAHRPRLHRPRPAGAADDARPQRQRLLRVDLRRPARRLGDRHLDRRRRRAERRSAPRARRHASSTRSRTTRRWSWPTSAPR